jgi:hypothetical protein
MQASAEAAAAPGEASDAVSKKLDGIITLLAKAPISRLRSLIQDMQPSLLPPANTGLEATVKAAMEALWAKTGSWPEMVSLLHKEMDPVAQDTTQWMRAAVAAANELTETKIKELIKTRGGGRVSIPRPKRKGSEDGKAAPLVKSDYLAVLVDLMREQEGNDYKAVTLLLQAEITKTRGTKGFGGK